MICDLELIIITMGFSPSASPQQIFKGENEI